MRPALIVALLCAGCPAPGDSADTEVAEPTERWAPPAWMWQAQHLTVPAERGWRFEIDEDFELTDLSVPALFVLPDGRFGMLATRMGDTKEHYARSLLTSDDGLEWSEPAPLMWPGDFAIDCGNRLQDASVWVQDEQTYRFVFEGFFDRETPNEQPLTETFLCHATSSDGASFELADDYLWTGERDAECNSVLSALTTADDRGLFFYNGDLTHQSAEGPGIRAFSLDPASLAVQVETPGPLLPWHHVDPNPVYLEGGGLRLYHTWFADQYGGELAGTGIGAVDLGEDLEASGEPTLVLEAIGSEQEGDKPMDPTLLMLPDGQLVMYFTSFVMGEEGNRARVRRAFAVD